MGLSKKYSNDVLDFVYSTTSCNSSENFNYLINCLKQIIPFEFATCVLRRKELSAGEDSYEVINIDYPKEWLQLYISKKFNLIDPIIIENFSNFKIQYWSDTYKIHNPPKNFLEISNSFGLEKGYTYGVRTIRNTEASLFSIAGASVEHDPLTETILKYTIPHLHQVLTRISTTIPPCRKIFLTTREKEVLNWISQGKSSWDISVILGISEKTVNFHVGSLMQKLDAVSRSHAVAIAFQLGLLCIG